jgi:Protein of unknown function (DUF3575)
MRKIFHSGILIGLSMFFIIGAFNRSFSQELKEKRWGAILSADPVGFLTFGPLINGEMALSKNFSMALGYRQSDLGLMTNALTDDLVSSWTVSFSIKYHFSQEYERPFGWFIGPHIEYGKSNREGISTYNWFGQMQKEERSYDVLTYGIELGYKWVFRDGFSLELSDNIGVISSKRNDSFYQGDEWNIDAYVLYILSAKLGIAF